MTYATETDIRELKTAIDGNTRAVKLFDRRLETHTRTTEANAKAIADLTISVTGLREEMRVGFSGVQGQITNLDTKLEGKINILDTKFDERSKSMGQRLDGKELAQRPASNSD